MKDDKVRARVTRKTLWVTRQRGQQGHGYKMVMGDYIDTNKEMQGTKGPKVLVVILENDNNGMKEKSRVYYLAPQIKTKGTHESLKMGLGQSDIYFFINIFE